MCTHENIRQVGPPRCFMGPIPGAEEDRSAHGNITITQECIECGVRRLVNVNGCSSEEGPWDENNGR